MSLAHLMPTLLQPHLLKFCFSCVWEVWLHVCVSVCYRTTVCVPDAQGELLKVGVGSSGTGASDAHDLPRGCWIDLRGPEKLLSPSSLCSLVLASCRCRSQVCVTTTSWLGFYFKCTQGGRGGHFSLIIGSYQWGNVESEDYRCGLTLRARCPFFCGRGNLRQGCWEAGSLAQG